MQAKMNPITKEMPVKNKDKKPEKLKKERKLKQKKKKRLIIRNLSFKVGEEDLKNLFSKFGSVSEVRIPTRPDGRKRGFAFIQFEDTKSLINAMKEMNYKEIEGRRVAIDYAIDKTKYTLKQEAVKREEKDDAAKKIKDEPGSDGESDQSESEDEVKVKDEDSVEAKEEDDDEEDENERRANEFLKDFDASVGSAGDVDAHAEDSSDDSSDEEDEAKDDAISAEQSPTKKRIKKEPEDKDSDLNSPSRSKKTRPEDTSEGKTVFLRNVSFTTTKESLQDAMEEYGKVKYCLLCVDPVTGHSRGTAFVKFEEKSMADKLVDESSADPGFLLDGRRLNCSFAVSRDEISKISDHTKKPKDKRNLALLKVGLIMANSEESEGVSPSDMAKRMQLEMIKKRKLRNVNFFVSDVRLAISNLPRELTDAELRSLCKSAAGKGAVIKEARVMKEFSKTDSEGKPLSKGFGFVSFSKHEDALKAVSELNNNPHVFTPNKRPIVEFSVESKMALMSKEKRKEKVQMRNKRRSEEKKERLKTQESSSAQTTNPSGVPEKGRKKNRRKKQNKNASTKRSLEVENTPIHEGSPPKKQKKQKQRKDKKYAQKSDLNSISSLASKYKEKLLNKLSK